MNKLKSKFQTALHTAVGATLLSAPMASSAKDVACTGDQQNMGGCVEGVLQNIITTKNVASLGNVMTFVGLAIVVWKIIQIVFQGKPAKEEVAVLVGGLIVAVIGTKLGDIITTFGFELGGTVPAVSG